MSGLEGRVKAAVTPVLERLRDPAYSYVGADVDVMAAAIVAACGVLAEEFGPRPEDAAPPVRELPTEPGAVVLVDRARGEDYGGRPGFWTELEEAYEVLHPHTVGTPSVDWLKAMEVEEWRAATVVPTAVHEAAVKALRDVVALLDGPQSGDAQEAQDAAINALAGIEGWAGL